MLCQLFYFLILLMLLSVLFNLLIFYQRFLIYKFWWLQNYFSFFLHVQTILIHLIYILFHIFLSLSSNRRSIEIKYSSHFLKIFVAFITFRSKYSKIIQIIPVHLYISLVIHFFTNF